MPRVSRIATGGTIQHVLNRAVDRETLFKTDLDYAAFESLLFQARNRLGTRVLAYCIMPNHWHLVVAPSKDGELSEFMKWLTGSHSLRWRANHNCYGGGPIYQGRFKSIPVSTDRQFYLVCRYVERNPVKAGLVLRAEDWRWSSAWRRASSNSSAASLVDTWPVPIPANWKDFVNDARTEDELTSSL
ncbi:MAG: transposase [Planctomycetes bacterium]|nr:transposase [Planctomycetota bacterium]